MKFVISGKKITITDNLRTTQSERSISSTSTSATVRRPMLSLAWNVAV